MRNPFKVRVLIQMFNRPLTLSLALLGVATLPAGGLLQVVGLRAAAPAQGVRLITTLSKGRGSLRLEPQEHRISNNSTPVLVTITSTQPDAQSCLSHKMRIIKYHMFRHLCLEHHWHDSGCRLTHEHKIHTHTHLQSWIYNTVYYTEVIKPTH